MRYARGLVLLSKRIRDMNDHDFTRQMQGFSLTTAEILYHLPDHPTLLQSYIWQDYDKAPSFPYLKKFLEFWNDNLDGALHEIRVAHRTLIQPAQCGFIDAQFLLH